MLTETKQDIEWPNPVINNPDGALTKVACSLEQVRALFHSNTSTFEEAFIIGAKASGLDECSAQRAHDIWLIYTLGEEKLDEIDRAFAAIENASFLPRTPVGKHVDIQRQRAYIEALEAFRAASSAPLPDNAISAVFDAIAGPASDTLQTFVNARSPDLRSLHEKMFIVKQEGAIHTDGVLDALFADVEHLARRYEIAGDDEPAAGRPEWERAVAEYRAIRLEEESHLWWRMSKDDPDIDKIGADHSALITRIFQAFDRVVQMPAPDYLAVAEKLDVTMDVHDEHDHVLEAVKFAAADIRRLCGEA